MPKFRVVSPSGIAWEVDAPEGATQADAIAYIQKQSADNNAVRAKHNEQFNRDAVDMAKAPLIGAGRQADKLKEGVKELGLSANVAGREAMGMESGDQLRQLAQQDTVQRSNDAAYAPLKEKHPFLTGAGETAFLAGAPMGQASAAARVGVPAAVAAANAALSYGSAQKRGLGAVESGGLAALGGGAGEVVRRVISPAASQLSSAQQRTVQNAAGKVGYKPRASELTGNETLRRVEDAVARQPGGAGPMRELMDQNDRAIARHASKSIGENSEQLTTDVFAAASERRGKTYDDLRSRANMPVVQEIFDAADRALKMLSTGDKVGPKKEAADMIERLKDELFESKQFDGQTYQSWTTDLAAKSRELGKTHRTAAAALREVEKKMDEIARGPDAPAWAKADKEHASQELLMKPGMVNEQTGKVSQVKVGNQLERQFGKNWKTGNVSGELADIGALGRAMPPMREGSPTAGRESFMSLPGWALAIPNNVLARGLTSEFGRDYLSRGLLGNPALSGAAGGLLGRGSIPLSIAEIESLLLGYQ